MCPQLTAHVAVGSSVAVLQTSLGLDTGSKTTLIGLVSISTLFGLGLWYNEPVYHYPQVFKSKQPKAKKHIYENVS